MCNVFIPEAKVVRPGSISDLSYQAADLESGRFNYTGEASNLEGDYPQSIGGMNANKGSPIAYADVGPVPSGPGYEKLKAILEYEYDLSKILRLCLFLTCYAKNFFNASLIGSFS